MYDDPDRLRRPVCARSGDEWEEVGWDEALDLVADRLADTINDHGRDAVGVYLGNPNVHALVHSDPRRCPWSGRCGTRNRFSATTVDQAPHQLVAWQLFGHQLLLPIPDLDRTSVLPGVRGEPDGLQRLADDRRPTSRAGLRALKARGGRMVVLDPRRTETAKVASEHHFVRPGTDAVVLLAMLHTLFEDGLTAPPAYVDGVERLRALVAPFTPELAEQVSAVPAADDTAAHPRALRRGRRRGLRPGGGVDDQGSARSASGRSAA